MYIYHLSAREADDDCEAEGAAAAAEVEDSAVVVSESASAGVHMPLIHDDTDEYPSPMAVPTMRTCEERETFSRW
jgi:hypothetical protein